MYLSQSKIEYLRERACGVPASFPIGGPEYCGPGHSGIQAVGADLAKVEEIRIIEKYESFAGKMPYKNEIG